MADTAVASVTPPVPDVSTIAQYLQVPVSTKHLLDVVRGRATDPDPIDLAHVTRWASSTTRTFRCTICTDVCDVAYETHFEWRDGPRYTYVEYMCPDCMRKVCLKTRNAKDSRYVNGK